MAGEGTNESSIDSVAADAVTAEVMRNGLLVAVEEASRVVVRSAHSTFIQEGADACAALLDTAGQLIAQSTSTSLMHSASLRCTLPAVLDVFPLDAMQPGDVFAVNDPYLGGIHANDVLVFRPIFAGGVVGFFAGTLVHVADLGGAVAGGLASLAADTFAEGLPFRRSGSMRQASRMTTCGASSAPTAAPRPRSSATSMRSSPAPSSCREIQQLQERYGQDAAGRLHLPPPRRDRTPDAARDRRAPGRALRRLVHDRQRRCESGRPLRGPRDGRARRHGRHPA